jgi:hypothetical protein
MSVLSLLDVTRACAMLDLVQIDMHTTHGKKVQSYFRIRPGHCILMLQPEHLQPHLSSPTVENI